MKYEDEYEATTSRDEFIKLMLKNHPHLKKSTAVRRYYDLNKPLPKVKREGREEREIMILADDVVLSKPTHLKMLTFYDLEKYKPKLTQEYLRKYGFKQEEINWLIKNGKI